MASRHVFKQLSDLRVESTGKQFDFTLETFTAKPLPVSVPAASAANLATDLVQLAHQVGIRMSGLPRIEDREGAPIITDCFLSVGIGSQGHCVLYAHLGRIVIGLDIPVSQVDAAADQLRSAALKLKAEPGRPQ